MKRPLTALLAVLSLTSPASFANCNGLERWSIKTLQDPDVSRIVLTPKVTTVDDLIAVKQSYHETLPRNGIELQRYQVKCKIEGYKSEADGDFHIVISDPKSGKTMIAEIPDPDCPNVAKSASVDNFRNAQKEFAAIKTNQKSAFNSRIFRVQPGYYTITGVGFIDKIHGQTGHADNGVEIHPVLSIVQSP